MSNSCCRRILLYCPSARDSLTSEAQCRECGKKYSIPRRNWDGCEEFRPKNASATKPGALYLKSFELIETYRDIEPFSMTFRPGLNVIVGENGSGKSTILKLLAEQESKISKITADHVDFKFFDTEKMNPRVKNLDSMPSDFYGFGLLSRFKSHGQTMLPIVQASAGFKSILLLIDEPEAGLSLSSQKKILDSFEEALKNNCQILAATHSYLLIKSVEEVFSMDEKVWMSSKDYLKKY